MLKLSANRSEIAKALRLSERGVLPTVVCLNFVPNL